MSLKFASMKNIIRTYNGIAICLAFITYPALLILGESSLISQRIYPFSPSVIIEICLWIVISLLSYTFIWRPLIFAFVILLDKIHLPGRNHCYVSVPLCTSNIDTWPEVSIHLPVHTESWEIIKPTLERAVAAVHYYNRHCKRPDAFLARFIVSDDGLRVLLDNKLEEFVNIVRAELEINRKAHPVLTEEGLLFRVERAVGRLTPYEREGILRIIFYEKNDVTFVARPKHQPGYYERQGEFPKASNLNETLRLDKAIENYLNLNPGSTSDSAWETVREEAHWSKFFVSKPPCIGDFILLLDKDSGTPEEVLTQTIPEFIADPSLAYTVHPTVMENDQENLVTKIVSPGASLYFNYWLPFTAHSGILFFSGHNVILRKEALRQIDYWPENRIAEDYVATLRIQQKYCPQNGLRYHGLYVNFPRIIFTETVPTRFLPFLQMIKKYTAGTFQMFVNPVFKWPRHGLWTEDIRSMMKSASFSVQEKLSAFLVFIPYLAFVPLVFLTVLTLHFISSEYVVAMLVMSVGVLLASNSPFWAAHWRAWCSKQDPFRIRSTFALLSFVQFIPVLLFYIGIPFHLFAMSVSRLLGEEHSFTATSCDEWKGESPSQVIQSILRVTGKTQLMALCYLILVSIYLGKPHSWKEGLRLGLCVQWGVGTIIAPFLFDSHLVAAIRYIRFKWTSLKKIMHSLVAKRIYARFSLYNHETLISFGLLGALLLATLLIRLLRIDYNAPHMDESFYQVVGERVLNGEPTYYSIIVGSVYLWPIIAYIANCIGGPVAPRVVTAFLGTATVGVVYFLGKHLWMQWSSGNNKRSANMSGIFSAILFSTAPSSIWISRTATLDALAVFLLSIGTLFLVLENEKHEKNYYFYSMFAFLLSMASSYSVIICFPFIIGYAIARALNHQELMRAIRQFVIPFLFLLVAYYMLNYSYFLESIVNNVLHAVSIPQDNLGIFGVLKEVSRRMPTILIVSVIVLSILFYPRRKRHKDGCSIDQRDRRRNIIFYSLIAFSVLFYYLSQGHIRAMDRKLSVACLFALPVLAYSLTQIFTRLSLTTARFRVSFPILCFILMFMLYIYANPIVRKDEQSYLNMDSVLAILSEEVLPRLPKNAIIGYTSYDNLWYLKQQLEGDSIHPVYIDETGPWAGHWLNRLESGWRPDALVGMLSSRFQTQEQQAHEEDKAIIKASQLGYHLYTSIPMQDTVFGEGTVYILMQQSSDTIHESQDTTIQMDVKGGNVCVAYSPTGYNPERKIYPNAQSIRIDLSILRSEGFRGLVTYGAGGILEDIPEMARNEGFDKKIIMGIWDPFSSEEWSNAVSQSKYVDGYCLGNEGLDKRYSKNVLAARMQLLRTLTGKPVTTSEKIQNYFDSKHKKWLLQNSDFIFPTVHPYWAKISTPEEAVAWTVTMFDSLATLTNKEIVFKEVGLPSEGDPCCSETEQADYYSLLEQTQVNFVYFEAFDQQWKSSSSVDSFWGLHRADRTPKLVLKDNERDNGSSFLK